MLLFSVESMMQTVFCKYENWEKERANDQR